MPVHIPLELFVPVAVFLYAIAIGLTNETAYVKERTPFMGALSSVFWPVILAYYLVFSIPMQIGSKIYNKLVDTTNGEIKLFKNGEEIQVFEATYNPGDTVEIEFNKGAAHAVVSTIERAGLKKELDEWIELRRLSHSRLESRLKTEMDHIKKYVEKMTEHTHEVFAYSDSDDPGLKYQTGEPKL